MTLIRATLQLFGMVVLAVGGLLGLSAVAGYLLSDDAEGKVVAGVLGGFALALVILGVRVRGSARRAAQRTHRPVGSGGRAHTGLHYEDLRWGNPPPSRKQFGYAIALGVAVQRGMTKSMLSDAIDTAIEQQRDGEPATKEQLRTIKACHGILPRDVTRGEAQQIIEFLEDHALPCPFCGIDIIATDDACCACGKSLRGMRIPLRV